VRNLVMPTDPRETLRRRQTERQEALEREKEEAARRAPAAELATAWEELAQCTLSTLGLTDSPSDRPRFYEEFASRMIRVGGILKAQGHLAQLEKLEGKETALDHAINLMAKAANGATVGELAGLLQETAEDPDFIACVGIRLRYRLRDLLLTPTGEVKQDCGCLPPSAGTLRESDRPPYDPRAQQPRTLGELERWMCAAEASKRGSMIPFPVSRNPPPIPGLDRLDAYCTAEYGEQLSSVETVRRLIGRYILARDVSTEEAIASALQDVADTLAPGSRPPQDRSLPAEPHNAISSIEELRRLEKLYRKAGQPFNPAVGAGSPAALHLIARHKRQQEEDSNPDNKVEVGIVVALEEEFRDLYGQLAVPARPVPDEDTGRSFYLFEHPSSDPQRPYRCAATLIGQMGHPTAALATDSLLRRWNPRTVVMVGLAGGISRDVRVGDVVAAEVVDSYLDRSKAVPSKEAGRFEFELAGEPYRPSSNLTNKLKNFEFTCPEAYECWRNRCSAHLETLLDAELRDQLLAKELLRPTIALKTGHMASGPVVGAAKPFLDWLRSRNRAYLALEMEAAGFRAAISERADPQNCLVLRGICDYGDQRKKKLDKVRDGAFRRYAMQNVIRLLWALLERDALPRHTQ
jgi:nucleoside phosphorylase